MKISLIAIALFACSLLFGQAGSLDNSYGTGGIITQNLSAPQVTVIDMVQQTDGKLVVLAKADYDHHTRTVVLRYNANGTLDNTFDGDGMVVTQMGPAAAYTDNPIAIKLQADGKILVCGLSSQSVSFAIVVRYNTNGSLDTGFGSTGIIYITDNGVNKLVDMVVLPAGEIVLLTTSSDFFRYLVLIKLNANGSHSNSFGTNGVVRLTVNDNYEPEYTQLELQTDGKFIVGGTPHRFPGPGDFNFMIVRVNANGTLDATFGTAGELDADAGPAETDNFVDMALTTGNKIVATGTGFDGNRQTYTYAVRINTNGTPDNTFGTNGWQYINAATTGFGSYGQMALQTDGRPLIAGFARNALGTYTIAAARLTAAGVLDSGFDGDGVALLQVNSFSSYGIAPVQQVDGNVAIAGNAGNAATLSTTVGRFTASGITDNTVAAGSTAIAYIGSSADYDIGMKVLVQTDQKIVNIRKRKNGFLPDVTVTRHNADGSFDNTFGASGKAYLDFSGEYSYLNAALLTNNKLMVVVALQEIVKGYQIALLRMNDNGSADATFGTNGKLYVNTNPSTENRLQSAQVQTDGKTVLLTSETRGSSYLDTSYLVKLATDGTFDNTFNSTGKLRLSDTAIYDRVFAQPDGKILLTFTSKNYGYLLSTFVIRYNANGTIDNTFNAGQALLSGTNSPLMAVDTDGSIIVTDKDGLTSKLNANGTFNTAFDTDGMVQLNYHYNILSDVKIQSDGKIVLGGNIYSDAYDSLYFQAIRIKTNGAFDSTFGTNGIVGINVVYDNQNNSESLALQADGKIIMTGYTTYNNTYNSDFASIRLNIGSGTIYTFTGSGSWTVSTNWANNAIPPAILPAGSSIIIDPVPAGVCILNVTQHISSQASLTVKAGKSFVVPGNLIMQ